jgi:hypothetical protein
MSVSDLINYDAFSKMIDHSLDIYGQPCSVFVPKQQVTLGYEDLGSWVERVTGIKDIANSFQAFKTKVWVEFNVKRGVYYHYNLNPEDSENQQLVRAFLPLNSLIREGSFIRTSLPGTVSIWGDLIFYIVKPVDDGLFKPLVRTYFMRPVAAAELHKLLDISKMG